MRKISDRTSIEHWVEKHGLRGICGEALIGAMSLCAYEKGERICSAGSEIDQLYLLVDGKLKVFSILPNGKTILLRFNEPLALIGDAEWATGQPPRCSVECVEDSLLLSVAFARLDASNDVPWLRFVMKHIANKLDTNSNAIGLNVLYPVENRIASYLLSVTTGENPGVNVREIQTSKLQEIAELIGTSYRHLNRILAKFAEDGIVERRSGGLTVLDLGKLRKLAEGMLYN
ncbi:cyclic nucleotide-binding domain-containing protein [Cohnella thailandensis]|uniref:Crp/Fnr family transcriptional regulator n=1 Tax=Cohnella thailandensis TaxID=557557 RepID=A0A841SZD2_9BACL|nr:Crp/Fnr family transcriptional regulator [Cohnella thailandensis]MBP1974344.1 CRP-like cAMP-binding protein [Cohnella thailandensis]